VGRADVIRMTAENPQIDSTYAEVLRAQAQQGRVEAAQYPSLVANMLLFTSLAAENSDNAENGVRSRTGAYRDFNIDQVRPGVRGDVTGVLPLYTFGKIGFREKAALAAERSGVAQTELTRATVIFDAVDIYESYLLAREFYVFLQDVKGIGERSVENTKARLEVADPDTRRGDLLRLETSLKLAETLENQVKAGMAQALEGLRAYLSIPNGVKIEVMDDVLAPVSSTPTQLEDMIALARDNRAEFAALTEGINAYRFLADAERADYLPDFFLGGYVSGAYTPDRDWLENRYVLDPFGHFIAGAGVGLRWTLDWDGASHRSDEVMADMYKLEGLLRWAEQGIPAEVNLVFQEVERARADITAFEEGLPAAREWLLRATTDFSTGLGPSYEVTDAVTQFVLLNSGRIEAVYRLNRSLAELAKVTGTLTDGQSPLYPGEGVQ
ncbi:MAG: TolC family protein, partial [Myxococcota bacterium]